MKTDGTFDFELEKPIEVHGVEGAVSVLTFHEMTHEHDEHYMKLRKFVLSGFTGAMSMAKDFQDMVDPEAVGEEVELDPDDETGDDQMVDLLNLTLGSSDALEGLKMAFSRLVSDSPSICYADGKPVKSEAWKRLHPEDKIKAALKYCVFFDIGLGVLSKNT